MGSVDSGVVADSCTGVKVIYDDWIQMRLIYALRRQHSG